MPAIGTPAIDVTVHVLTGGMLKFWANEVEVMSNPERNAAFNGKEFIVTPPSSNSMARVRELLVTALLEKRHILCFFDKAHRYLHVPRTPLRTGTP